MARAAREAATEGEVTLDQAKAEEAEQNTAETGKAEKVVRNRLYSDTSVISFTAENLERAAKYRGQRADWHAHIQNFAGKTVKEFAEGSGGRVNGQGKVQAPGGWVRFFIMDGSLTVA